MSTVVRRIRTQRCVRRKGPNGELLAYPKDCIDVEFEGDLPSKENIISDPSLVKRKADDEAGLPDFTSLKVGSEVYCQWGNDALYIAKVRHIYRANVVPAESEVSEDEDASPTPPPAKKGKVTNVTVEDKKVKNVTKKKTDKKQKPQKLSATEKKAQKQEERIQKRAEQEKQIPKVATTFARDAAMLSEFDAQKKKV